MRVLIFNQYALPAGEPGITRHADIGAELVRRGHQVTIVASDFDYFARRPTNRRGNNGANSGQGINFVWLRTGSYVANDRRRTASMLRYATSAVRAGLKTRPVPDVVVGSSPQPLAALAASAVARLRKRPWVFETRDIWPSALVDMKALSEHGRTHRMLERLERYLYTKSAAVVSVPPGGCLRLSELGLDEKTCVHIPNAASTILTEPAALPDSLEKSLSHSDGHFVVAYTGAIGVMQDFDTVLSALVQLRDLRSDLYQQVRVLVVGGGVAAASVARKAAELRLDHITVHPPVPKAVARSVILSADACLLTLANADVFRYGLSPNKLFDYFAAGKPVLVASSFSTPMDEARAGIRYMPGDPTALSRALAQIMDTPIAERTAMGDRGRQLVEAKYSIKAIADRYESLLEDVVSRGRGSGTGE